MSRSVGMGMGMGMALVLGQDLSTCSAWGIRRPAEVNALRNKFKSTLGVRLHGHQIDWNTKLHPRTRAHWKVLSQDAL